MSVFPYSVANSIPATLSSHSSLLRLLIPFFHYFLRAFLYPGFHHLLCCHSTFLIFPFFTPQFLFLIHNFFLFHTLDNLLLVTTLRILLQLRTYYRLHLFTPLLLYSTKLPILPHNCLYLHYMRFIITTPPTSPWFFLFHDSYPVNFLFLLLMNRYLC